MGLFAGGSLAGGGFVAGGLSLAGGGFAALPSLNSVALDTNALIAAIENPTTPAGDAEVVASAIQTGVKLITNDARILGRVPGVAVPF